MVVNTSLDALLRRIDMTITFTPSAIAVMALMAITFCIGLLIENVPEYIREASVFIICACFVYVILWSIFSGAI